MKPRYRILPVLTILTIILSACFDGLNIQTGTVSQPQNQGLQSTSPVATTAAPSPTVGLPMKKSPVPSITPSLSPMTVEKFKALLLHNPECKFPCWWEIEPGETSVDESHKRLLDNGIGLSETINPIGDDFVENQVIQFYTPDLVSNLVEVYSDGKTVAKIHLKASSNSMASFWEIWSPYQPKELLQEYNPEQILALIYSNRPSRETGNVIYRLIFLLSDYKTMVEYHGLTKEDNGTYEICPNILESGNLSPTIDITIGETSVPTEGFFDLALASGESFSRIISGFQSTVNNCLIIDKSFLDQR